MPSAGAPVCSREAVLTTSPWAVASPSIGRAFTSTTASPVAIPIRTRSAAAVPSEGSRRTASSTA